jgi:hypothetical protein
MERLFTYKPVDDYDESENETDMSESEPEYQHQEQDQRPTETPKLLPPPSTDGDVIARAIENRRDISFVEYEYYNKLLKDRLQQQEKDRIQFQQHFEKSPMSRPVAMHSSIVTPNDIIRNTFLKKLPELPEITTEPTLKRRAVSPEQPIEKVYVDYYICIDP